MSSIALSRGAPRRWPEGWLLAILWVLFLGPPAAALLAATGLPLVADTGHLARGLLATYVCPTPAKSIELLGAPMAVCARCWGATIGLWAGYLLAQRAGGWRPVATLIGLPWPARLALAALPLLLWVWEIQAWPAAPLWLLLLNGAAAGLGAGLLICSAWPGLRRAA